MPQQPSAMKVPNHYELSGDGIHITYSTTSFAGPPTFVYHDSNQNKTFTGNQIQSVDTEAGTVVSVPIFVTIDSGSTSFSVLIPRVNLGSADSTNITSYGITALHRFGIPAPVGQLDFYTPHQMTGTAALLFFVATQPKP
jgi:hypothetical protein